MTATGVATAALRTRVRLDPVTAADGAEFTRLARAGAELHRGWIKAPTIAGDFATCLDRFAGPDAEGRLVSRRLVERLGFAQEGLAKGFIRIDGQWRDHERWAITEDTARRHYPEDFRE